LRGLAIASRFVLVFGLARLLIPAEVGEYGIMAATISFGMLFIGGEYYTYSQRELLAEPRARWSFVIQHHALAAGVLYAGLLPLQLLLFASGLLPIRWLGWFFALLVVEHIAQEANRLLITIGRPLVANVVFLIRTGVWVWVAVAVLSSWPERFGLELVFGSWLAAGLVAVAVAAAVIYEAGRPWRWWKPDRAWLRSGFETAFVYLMGTVALKALSTADRHLVARISSAETVGVYVVYAGIATVISSLLDSGVYAFLYPRLVKYREQGDHQAYLRTLRQMARSAIALSTTLALGCAVAAPWVLAWTGREVYLHSQPLLWILVIGSVIQGVGMVPHYALYANRADQAIVGAHVTAVPVFALTTLALAGWINEYAVGWALVSAYSWIVMWKTIAYSRLQPLPFAVAEATGRSRA
jgi:O-antigen/teichoic acid export membrane protein